MGEQLDDRLAINADGTITAFSGKVELGTGVRTALAQIVAEELDVLFERVQMVLGDTALTPDEGYTAGSMTIQRSGSALRLAAAEARLALLELASEQLDSTLEELTVHDGLVSVKHDPERTASYVELMGGKRFNREVTGNAPLKPPSEYKIVGTAARRTDLPPKITGQPSFVQDVRLPGMVHARMVHPPSFNAELISIDESSVQNIPGLIKVVQQGNFVGVVAEREEQAITAARQLKVEWRETAKLPTQAALYDSLRTQSPARDEVVIETGNVRQALQSAAKQIRASYHQPYQAHASIGPACSVANVTKDGITVWSSTQGPHPLRGSLAQLLNISPDFVHLIHAEGAGCYGQNGSDDVAAEAVTLSQAVGRPVRLQWSREDEFRWEPKAAAMVIELQAGLDNDGNITAWIDDVYSPTHTARPRVADLLFVKHWLAGQPIPPPPFYFGAGRNAPPSYQTPNQQVRVHYLAQSPLHVSSFRTLGGAGNTFANESFTDELATAAGIDPLQFRLRHLSDPRAREVLAAVAAQTKWAHRPAPQAIPTGVAEGRGLAFAQYENSEAYVAMIADVQVDITTGNVRVTKIVVAHDCGLIINPDGLRNQIEGNILQALSRALKEEVTFDETRITSLDWQSYPILTFSEVPEIEIILLNRPDQPAMGAGEPATVTVAAAVANAIFNATGVRLRQVPFTSHHLLQRMRQ